MNEREMAAGASFLSDCDQVLSLPCSYVHSPAISASTIKSLSFTAEWVDGLLPAAEGVDRVDGTRPQT